MQHCTLTLNIWVDWEESSEYTGRNFLHACMHVLLYDDLTLIVENEKQPHWHDSMWLHEQMILF